MHEKRSASSQTLRSCRGCLSRLVAVVSAGESELAQRVLGASPDPHLCLKLHEANYALSIKSCKGCYPNYRVFDNHNNPMRLIPLYPPSVEYAFNAQTSVAYSTNAFPNPGRASSRIVAWPRCSYSRTVVRSVVM